jgi:hypothetical protein
MQLMVSLSVAYDLTHTYAKEGKKRKKGKRRMTNFLLLRILL